LTGLNNAFLPYAKDNLRLITSRHPTGKVIFQDDFESYTAGTLRGWSDSSQSGGSVSPQSTFPFDKIKHLTITAPAVADNYALAQKFMGLSLSRKLGFELHFCPPSTVLSYIRDFWFDIVLYEQATTNAYRARLKYLVSAVAGSSLTGKWQWESGDGVWSDILGGSQKLRANYHHFKMVVNFNKQKYASLLCDDLSLNISDLSILSVTHSNEPSLIAVDIMLYSVGLNSAVLYVDDVVVTDNEP